MEAESCFKDSMSGMWDERGFPRGKLSTVFTAEKGYGGGIVTWELPEQPARQGEDIYPEEEDL